MGPSRLLEHHQLQLHFAHDAGIVLFLLGLALVSDLSLPFSNRGQALVAAPFSVRAGLSVRHPLRWNGDVITTVHGKAAR